MKYWSGLQVCANDIGEAETMSCKGYPATCGSKSKADGEVWAYYEMEIIPNTIRDELYLNPNTFNEAIETVVDVIVRTRTVNDITWFETTYVLALSTFGVRPSLIGYADSAEDATLAYDRAMKGV